MNRENNCGMVIPSFAYGELTFTINNFIILEERNGRFFLKLGGIQSVLVPVDPTIVSFWILDNGLQVPIVRSAQFNVVKIGKIKLRNLIPQQKSYSSTLIRITTYTTGSELTLSGYIKNAPGVKLVTAGQAIVNRASSTDGLVEV